MGELKESRRWGVRRLLISAFLLFILFIGYRVLTVYTVRSGECRPRPIDPKRRLLTRTEGGTLVSYPERVGFPAQTRPLLVMTYNIAGHDELWRENHIARIAAVINQNKPDIVGLQEVHRGTWQSRFRDQVQELETATGMHGYFAPSYRNGRGEFGNLILTRGEILSSDVHELPSVGEPRALLETVLRIDGMTLDVYDTHLTTWAKLNRRNRREQLVCVSRHVQTSARPYLLMGDFNAPPDAPEVMEFRASHAAQICGEEIGISNPALNERIDYIFADYGWRVRSTRVLHDEGPSDHWPVIAELFWDRAAQPSLPSEPNHGKPVS
jgi:endonuclease/exonuclease/phosphatase family metal-dependent hydrolase